MAKTPTRRKAADPEYQKYREDSAASFKASKSKPKLVKMQRDDGKTADVHPDMIEHFRKGGYKEL